VRSRRDAELLAVALGIGSSSRIRPALESLGGAKGLYHAGAAGLGEAIDRHARRRLDAYLALTHRMLAAEARVAIEGPGDLVAYLGEDKSLSAVERFFVILLDARGRAIGRHEVARGTLTACLVHPREVFGPAIRARAASVIVAHNHPSGDPTPSAEDVALTERLASAGDLLGIPLVDHVITSASGHRSLGGAPGRDTCVHMAKDATGGYHRSRAVDDDRPRRGELRR
jgi:DNA repair protein RadC